MFIQVTTKGNEGRQLIPVDRIDAIAENDAKEVMVMTDHGRNYHTVIVTESIEQLAEMLQAVQAKPKPPELIYGRMYRVKFREQDKRNFTGINIEDIKAKYTRDGFYVFHGDRILNQIGWNVASFESVELLSES